MGKEATWSPSKPPKGNMRPARTRSESKIAEKRDDCSASTSTITSKPQAPVKGKSSQALKDKKDGVESTDQVDEDFPMVNTLEMSKSELTVFMMKLLKKLTMNGTISLRRKPKWWPEDVPWGVLKSLGKMELVSVIKECYKAHGKEELVQSVYVQSPSTPRKGTACITSLFLKSPDENMPQSPIISRGPKDLHLPFAVEIYICYFCEKEFLDKETMRQHQKHCEERPPELVHSSAIKPAVVTETNRGPPQISPKSTRLRLDVNRQFIPLNEFTGYLGLVPRHAASKIRARRKCSEISSDILEDSEPLSPTVPHTPRTLKSLISQLSREEPGAIARKRLSYSTSVDKRDETRKTKKEEDSSDTETDVETRSPQAANLLNIPITSLLGQKIQKYVQVDTVLPVVGNSESFCKTPTKNTFLEKLRKKPALYPIIYRPRRIAHLEKQNHLYKFSKKERKDFYRKLVTGLNSESRQYLKLLKKSSVVVARLTQQEILRWMTHSKMDRQLYKRYRRLSDRKQATVSTVDEFPAGPTLLSKNMDKMLGLRRSSKPSSALTLSNCVSEYMDAEVSKLQLTLYKCLLFEMSVLKPTVMVSNLQHNSLNMSSEGQGNVTKETECAKQSTQLVINESSPVKQIGATHDAGSTSKSMPKPGEGGVGKVCPDTPVLKKMLSASPLVNQSPVNKQLLDVNKTDVSAKQNTERKVESHNRVARSSTRSRTCTQKPCDEIVSVISVSSDSDSITSECCINCAGDGGRDNVRQRVGVDVRAGQKVTPGHTGDKLDVTQPLTVSVDQNRDLLLNKPLDIVNIMPSPSSSSGESDLVTPPLTPSHSPDCMDRQRPLTRSAKKCENTNLNSSPKPDSRVVKKLPSQFANVISQHLESLGPITRAKSLTPTSSPKKATLQSSSSLPNTPKGKNDSLYALLRRRVEPIGRFVSESPLTLSMLESTPLATRSSTKQLRSSGSENSTPIKLSPIPSAKSVSVFKTLQFKNVSNSPASPRNMKRLRSMDLEVQPMMSKRRRASESGSPRK